MNKALTDAADLIERLGWIQGQYCSGEGYCLVGAINASTTTMQDAIDAEDLVTKALDRSDIITWDNAPGIITWNDTPGRTKDEVLALLRKAAEL